MKLMPLMIVALAAVLLFWKIGSYPIAPSIYEGVCGLSALKVLEGDKEQIAKVWEKPIRKQLQDGSGVASAESNPFLIYPTALFLKWFGADDNYVTLRLASILYGLLSVGMLYLLATRLFHRGIGLIASFILATSTWALSYSRLCADLSATVFYFLLCLYVFIIIDRPDNPLGYIILGGLISLATYFYLPGRTIAPLVILFMLLRMLSEKGYFRSHYQYFILMLAALVLFLYLQNGNLRTYFRQNVPQKFYLWKMRPHMKFEKLLGKNLALYRGYLKDWDWKQGMVCERDASFDPVTRYCFLAGLIWLLIKIKKRSSRFVLIWTVFSLLPMLLTYAHFRRGILFAPAMSSVAAFGIYNSVYYGTIWMGRIKKYIKTIVILGILLPTAYLNVNHYFGLYATSAGDPDNPIVRRRDQVKALLDLMKTTRVYTDLFATGCYVEYGWPEGLQYEEKRLGLENSYESLSANEARKAFNNNPSHCALYLSNGELKTK